MWEFGGLKDSVAYKQSQQKKLSATADMLEKHNRDLKVEISQLKHQLSSMQGQLLQLRSKSPVRRVASVNAQQAEDYVQFDVYLWTPEKLLAIAEKELHFRNYEKSSQFYAALIDHFPTNQIVTDRVLFGAGISAYETGNKFEEASKYLALLVHKYPKSDYRRGAKLWMALSQYKTGDNKKFLATVEEFRIKYRNTDEWKILSRYYENINQQVR